MRSALISFVLFLAVVLITLFIAPTMQVQVALFFKWPESVVFSAPHSCRILIPWLQLSSPQVQSMFWPPIKNMALMDSAQWQIKIKEPGVLGKILRTATGYDSQHAQAEQRSLSCLQQLMTAIQSEPAEAIELLKTKMKQNPKDFSSWQNTLAQSCLNQEGCATHIMREMHYEKSLSQQTVWANVLKKMGPHIDGVILNELQSLTLGFSLEDTPQNENTLANLLVDVLVHNLKGTAQLLTTVQDEKWYLPIRWRIAARWAKIEGPREDLWPLVQSILNHEKTGPLCRQDAMVLFASLWPQHPVLVDELSHQLRNMAKSNPSKEALKIIRAFATINKREPQAVLEPLSVEQQQSLSLAIAELITAFKIRLSHEPDLMPELLSALHKHPLFADKSLIATHLFLQPGAADLGMDLLLRNKPIDAQVVTQLRKSFDTLPQETRVELSYKAKDVDLVAALLPALPVSRTQQIWKTRQSKALYQAVDRWSKQSDLSLALRAGYSSSALSRVTPSAKINNFNQQFVKNFKCEQEWIQTAQNIVQKGFNQPGFSPAVLSLLSCSEKEIDDQMLGRQLLNPKAQKKIKTDLSRSLTASPLQLRRLTQLLGMANQVPGSSLPAKIKQPGS